MKQFILEIFAWWHKQTMGTRLHTALRGVRVGEDEAGNVYYTDKERKKRWVIYNGPAEASMIPPGWHGWIHYRTDVVPTEAGYAPRVWEKPHQQNLTGTVNAYRPDGSLLGKGERPRVTGDYDAWSPE